MSGFYTEGEIGNTLAEAEGVALIPPTTGEVLGAQFNQTLAENPASRLARVIGRNLEANPITMSAEAANAEYGVEGRLSFTEPVSRTTARDLHDFHRQSAIREDVIARRQDGVGTGMVARFGVSLGAAILDPLNIASAFLPGVREARVASVLGASAAGVGGRLAVRAIAGGSQGLVGAAALEPLNYWLAQQDQDDYTMGDVLTNLAFGTALGGVMHGGIGLVRDRRAGLPMWSPEMHEAALRHTLASVAEGRPIDAAAAMEFTSVRTARQEIAQWRATLDRAEADARAAQQDATSSQDALAKAADALRLARESVDDITAERVSLSSRAQARGGEAGGVTALRFIDRELARQDLPISERLLLLIERDELLERRAAQDPLDPLEAARDSAQAAGVQALQQRALTAQERAETALRAAADATLRADAALRQASLVARSRMADVQSLIERSLRRAAYNLGLSMTPDEFAAMASRYVRAAPDRADEVLRDILGAMSKTANDRGFLPGLAPDTVAPSAADTVTARADQIMAAREAAAQARLTSSARGAVDPRDMAAERDAAVLRETAPQVDGASVADDLAEAQRQTQEISNALKAADKSFADAEVAAGRKAPETDPELVAADDLAKEGESAGRAFEAAAACAIGGRR